MKYLLTIALLLISSCARVENIRSVDVSGINRIGILSATTDAVDIVYVGSTIFGNNVITVPMPAWNIDESIEDYAIYALQRQYHIRDLGHYRPNIMGYYQKDKGFFANIFDFDGLYAELGRIGQDFGLDAIIFIYQRSGEYGASNAHVIQTVQNFALGTTTVITNLNAVLVRVPSGEPIIQTNTSRVGPTAPMSNRSAIEEPELALIIPEEADEITPQQRYVMTAVADQNLKYIVPHLVRALLGN